MDKFLIDQTVAKTGETKDFVSTCIRGITSFTHNEIVSNQYHNIRIPLFGIFKVNLKLLEKLTFMGSQPKKIIKKGK